jgi:hypothetical protein
MIRKQNAHVRVLGEITIMIWMITGRIMVEVNKGVPASVVDVRRTTMKRRKVLVDRVAKEMKTIE